MVQIKDSVLRDSGVPPGCFPASSRHAHLSDAVPALRHDMSVRHPVREECPHRVLTPDDGRDCQQLVNNLSRELYVVDFRRVVRGSKKVRIFRKNGLTFSKVVQVFPKHRNDTACKLKARWNRRRGFFPRKSFCARDLRTVVPFGPDRLRTAPAGAVPGIVNKF